ncbi:hypothetical protein DFP73DRAFT_598657 [Morchella snyderi]|nr:hypothetical protein DFP73DRAFT_598657 [Morchella snyderi]
MPSVGTDKPNAIPIPYDTDSLIQQAIASYREGQSTSLRQAASEHNVCREAVMRRFNGVAEKNRAHASQQLLTPTEEEILLTWAMNNPKILRVFFELWKSVVEKYNITSDRKFNMDEKGFKLDYAQSTRVIVHLSKKSCRFVTQDGNWELVTLLEGVRAAGFVCPPLIIHKEVHHQFGWHADSDKVAKDRLFAAFPSGWTEKLRNETKQKRTQDQPILSRTRVVIPAETQELRRKPEQKIGKLSAKKEKTNPISSKRGPGTPTGSADSDMQYNSSSII